MPWGVGMSKCGASATAQPIAGAGPGAGTRSPRRRNPTSDVGAGFKPARARTVPGIVGLRPLIEILRLVRELKHFPIPRHYLDAVLNVAAAVKVFHEKPFSLNAIRDSLAQLRNLRNALAHALPTGHDTETVRPAYALDDDDDD